MIDTMFFLLVFFMVTSLSMTMEKGLPVNLPHAASAHEEVTELVTLTITKGGSLFFDKDKINSSADISLRLSSKENEKNLLSVVINADRAVDYGKVIDIMDAVRQAGVSKIAVAVKP
jgi:biopolymer transport protein ExbD